MKKLIDTIPPEVKAAIEGKKVVDVGFGAGPGFVAGKAQEFDRPVPLEEGAEWLERYREAMRVGHIGLEDGTVIFFESRGFKRYDTERRKKMPRPGVVFNFDPPSEKE